MTPVAFATDDEAAGKVGKFLGIIAAVVIPFAAPAIFGAIAGSGILGSSLAAAAASGTMGALTITLGSAAVGAIINAGIAYAGGARGGDVWRAAGMGAIQGGLGGFSGAGAGGASAATAGAGAAPGAATAGLNAAGGVGPLSLAPSAAATAAGAAPNIAIGATVANGAAAANGASASIMSSLGRMFGNNPQLIQRLGAAVVNAAVNNTSLQGMDDLVAQQRAELQALQQQDAAAYAQRIGAAQQVLDLANRMDPAWLGRVRMADVAGVEANQYRQAMRNIATQRGGQLDFGQRRAYERASALHIGRSKALAYNQGWGQGAEAQGQLYGQAAGLFTGPNMQPWQQETELLLGQQRAHQQANRSTAAGFVGAFGERNYAQPTSPEQNNNDDDPYSIGLTHPFG